MIDANQFGFLRDPVQFDDNLVNGRVSPNQTFQRRSQPVSFFLIHDFHDNARQGIQWDLIGMSNAGKGDENQKEKEEPHSIRSPSPRIFIKRRAVLNNPSKLLPCNQPDNTVPLLRLVPSNEMRKILLVAVGGGAGTLLRFFVAEGIPSLHAWPPLATLLINVSGCLLISFLNFISDPSGRIYIGPGSRLLWMVGFCGGYTTFSTFSFISFDAIRKTNWSDLWGNIFLSQMLCLGAILLGYLSSKPAGIALTKALSLLRSKSSPIAENADG
jgi:fluoride exporter